MPDPNIAYPTEWVELYNLTSQAIDLGGAIIDDIASGGGAPYTIPADTMIAPYGYWVLDRTNYFNNAGDDVRLLAPTGTLIDMFTYTSSANDKSWARIPDGGPWIQHRRGERLIGDDYSNWFDGHVRVQNPLCR